MDRETLLTRIQHLLNKTVENGCTEEEAAAALAHAQRLMDQHNIALGELAQKEEKISFSKTVAWEKAWAENNYSCCLPVVEAVFGVKSVIWRKGKYTGKGTQSVVQILLFGDPAGVESATWAVNYLGPLYLDLWNRYRTAHRLSTSENQTYYYGLTAGFLDKLREDRAAHQTVQTGTALACLSKELVRQFNEEFPKLKYPKRSLNGSNDTYNAGRRDGRNINLARPLAGTKKALPR
jgi:Protein of unknown function (DUF2786)